MRRAGRQKGVPNKDKPFRAALWMETQLAAMGQPCPAPRGSLRYIARKLLERASEDTAAAREIGDRLDGRPAQELQHSGTIVSAVEIGDDELAVIASGGGDGVVEAAEDSPVLN